MSTVIWTLSPEGSWLPFPHLEMEPDPGQGQILEVTGEASVWIPTSPTRYFLSQQWPVHPSWETNF